MKILEVKNIHKSFGNTSVLKGVDFSMEEGEVVSILGSSGSGKTTLLRCINFLEKADMGEILVEGNTIFNALDKQAKKQSRFVKISLTSGLCFSHSIFFRNTTCLKM